MENIAVSDDEIEAEYKDMSDKNGMKLEDIKKYVSKEEVEDRLKAQKTIKFLVDNANFNSK